MVSGHRAFLWQHVLLHLCRDHSGHIDFPCSEVIGFPHLLALEHEHMVRSRSEPLHFDLCGHGCPQIHSRPLLAAVPPTIDVQAPELGFDVGAAGLGTTPATGGAAISFITWHDDPDEVVRTNQCCQVVGKVCRHIRPIVHVHSVLEALAAIHSLFRGSARGARSVQIRRQCDKDFGCQAGAKTPGEIRPPWLKNRFRAERQVYSLAGQNRVVVQNCALRHLSLDDTQPHLDLRYSLRKLCSIHVNQLVELPSNRIDQWWALAQDR
mmetsp:Transcript_30246/g.76391  ORF Transcript_30246/g.76391 Transcript_30246/m.76391 type:complete len:266 (-) Transcript_30246:155-952(-)